MKYKLYSNLDMNLPVCLIDKDFLYEILSDFNGENELSRIIATCNKDPKESWIVKDKPLNIFDVPLLSTNLDNSLCINQGRHRICWMISQGMNDIPIAVSRSAMKLISGCGYPIIEEYDMPCSFLPTRADESSGYNIKTIMSIFRKNRQN